MCVCVCVCVHPSVYLHKELTCLSKQSDTKPFSKAHPNVSCLFDCKHEQKTDRIHVGGNDGLLSSRPRGENSVRWRVSPTGSGSVLERRLGFSSLTTVRLRGPASFSPPRLVPWKPCGCLTSLKAALQLRTSRTWTRWRRVPADPRTPEPAAAETSVGLLPVRSQQLVGASSPAHPLFLMDVKNFSFPPSEGRTDPRTLRASYAETL